MEELKLCPFCGGKAFVGEDETPSNNTVSYGVVCRRCAAIGPVAFTEAGAVQKWNRRIVLFGDMPRGVYTIHADGTVSEP